MVSMTRSTFFKSKAAGRIGPEGRRFGKVVLYSVAELEAWVAAGMPPRHEWVVTWAAKQERS
jgi:hypothetical protein